MPSIDDLARQWPERGAGTLEERRVLVSSIIRQAMDTERELCAKLCEEHGSQDGAYLANVIRARLRR